MCQNSTNNTVKKVPTIYIDDEIEEIVLLEEEVRTSSKSARRQKAEEEKKIMLREKQYEMLSNHKPLDDDMKPYIKNEVIDLNSEDESSISKKHSHNSDINKTIRDQVFVDEVVIIDDDVSEVSVQPSAVSNLVVIKEFNKEDVLELSSDEDESFNVIPKEEEEKLLGDDAMDETNYSLVSTDISTITCRAAISVVDEPVHKINTNTSSTNITKTVHLDISTVKCFDSAIPLNKSNVSCLSAEDTLDSSSHGVDNLETLNSPQFKNNGSTEKPIFKAISEKVECEINSNQETLQSNEMLTSKLNMKDQEKMEELFNRDGTEKTNDMQMLEKCIDKHNEKLKDSGEKNLMEDMKVTKQITMEDNSSNDDKYCEAKTKENADVNIKHVELENAEVQIDENSGQQNKTDDHIGDFQVAENATSTFVETKTTKELCDHAKNELLELTQQESDKLCPVEQLIEEPTENNSINEVKNLIIHKERSMDDEKDILIEETSPGLSSGGNIETHLENNELSNIEATDVNIKYSEPLKQKEISGKNAETHLENNESGKIEVIDVKVKNTKPSEQKEKDEGSIITHLENNELSKIEAINADVTKSEPIKQKEKKATETSLENNEPNEIEANNVKIKNSKLSEQKEKGEEDIETHLEKKEQSKIENSKVLEQEEKDVNIIEEIAIAAAERNPENNITLEVSKTEHLLVNEEYTDNHSYQNDKASNPLKIEDSEALFENIDVETISDASNINNVKTVVADEKNETMKIHDKNLTADEIPSSHNNYSFDVEPNQSLVSKEINLSEKYDSENFNSGQFGENGDVTSQLSENKDILDTVIERSDHVNSGLNEEDLSQNKNKEKGNFEIINGASITSNGIKDNEISIQKIITSNEISNVEQSYKNATAGEDKYETLSSFVEEIEEEIIIRKNNVDSNEKSNKEESHVEHDIRNVNASCRQVSLKVTNDLSVSESNILSSDEIEESVAQEENYTHQNDQDNDLSKDDKPRITLYSKVNNNSQEKSLEVCDINDIKSQIDDFNSNNVNETDSFLEDPKEIELIKKQIDDERIECTMDFKEDKTDCDHTIATISQGEEASVDILNLTKTNPQLLTENVDICINSNSENQNTKSIEIQNNLLPNQEFFNQSSETVTEVIEIAGINYPEAETKNFKEYIEEIEEKTSEKRSSIYNDTEKLLDESKTGKESLLIITENHITVSEKDKNLPEEQGIVKEHNNDAGNNVNSNELLQIINQEAEELNRVEQLTEEPAGHFLEDNNTNDIEEIADKCTEDIGKNSLVEDTLLSSDLHTGEEETQEIYQFQNTEHEIEITTEGVEQFKLLEQKEFNKDYYVDIVTEETDVNEEVMKEGNTIDDQLEEHDVHSFIQENTYENINTNHFQVVKNTDPSVTEEIYYEKYIPGSSKESNLINNLNVQKEEIITEVDTLHLGISEEFIVSEDIPQSCEETTDKSASDNEYTLRNQLIPVTIQMGMKIEKIEIGNIVTNDQLIPQHLEICDIPNIPDENTSLDILATVASEVSRQDLLVGKKKKRTVHHERRKKQSYLKNKIKGVQERHTTKKKSNGALVVSHNIENKRVTRSAQIKKQTEIYHEPKCKPHDFVITDNSGVPPPANNIYTQKLPDVHLTSEDSNDSEGILLIDEDIDMKLSKSTKEILNSLGTKKFTYYDEETIEENITFCYEPKVKGTVLISIPDTFQGNFEFLTQIEQLDACSSHSTNKEDNMQSLQNDIVSSATDINSKTHFNDVLSPINDKNITETEPLDNKSDVGNTQIMEQAILEKNHKPFRTKAEQKDYDKFSLKPYVSIKRLYIISKNEEKTKHARSKSVDMGIVRNLCDEQLDSDTLNNKSENLPLTESENKASHEQTSKLISEQKVDRLPTEIKLKNNVIDETYDVEGNQDSDDDVPLLQRTQLESKQTKKSVTGPKCTSESKKEKSSRRGDFNKGIKGKADSKTKIKSKKSHINIKKEDGELSKNIISAEETVSTDEYKDTKVKHSTKKINTKTKLVEKQPKNNDSEIEVLKQNIKVEENIDTKIKDSIKSKEINEVSTDLFKSKEQCVHVSKQDKESKKSTTPCEKSNNQEKSDAENVTSVNASNYISLSAAHSNMQTSKDSIVSVWKGSVSSSMVEEDICPTNVLESENISKEKDNICIPQNNAQLVREAPTYEEYMKTSNTKYYTTPKLRRKSVSKHNLNRNEKNSDIKYEEAMQFIFSADKKYYTPPKLRRKSVVENEITSDSATVINKATPKQIKLSTSKVNILSKCKNTISPTTEKLKKKLETDFKLNCTELSTPEHTLNDTQINSHELEKDDLISNSENLGSNSTNNISPKSSKNALLLISEDEVPDIKCVNTDVSINDIKEQNVYVEATDIIIKSENNQDGNVLITDNKLEGPCVFGKIIDIALSPALEEELQQPQICNTSTAVDISKLQNKTSSEIQNDTSLQPPINKNEDTVPDGVIEDDENLDNLPLSERSSVSCQNQLTTSEIKIEMKPHKKGTKGIISNTESSSTVENKEKCDKDNQPENIVLNCDMQNKSVEDLVKIDSGNIKPQHKIKNKKSKTKPAEELRGIHENTTILKQENIQKEGNRKRNQSTKLKEKANKERYNKQKKYDKFSRNQKLSRKSMDTLTVDEYKNVKHDKKKRSSKAKPTEGLTKNNDIETETLNQNTGNEEQLKTKTKVKEVSKTSTELFQNREQYMSDPNLNSLNKKRTDSALQLEVSSKKEKKKSRKHEKLGPDYDTEENISEIKDTKNKSSKNDPQLEPKNFKTDIELQVQLCDMNRFKDKKSDGNSERVSSELSFVALPKNDMNNDHHSSKKEKDSDSQSKKSLNSKTEVEIFAKSNRVDDVLTASDVSKTSDVSIKATDFSSSCTRKNKIYEESNKKNKDKKDKRRANQKSEQSETIEKKKQEKNTKCSKTLEFEVNEDKNIDLTETNKSNTDVIATKKCTDNFHQVQALLTTSIEIKDSGGSEETNVEQAKQDVNKCMQEGEEKKIANDSHDILFKIPQDIKNSSNANEKVPLTQQESDISQVDELVELSLDTAHSNVNEKVPLTQQESDISQIDEPVEASLDTAHSSDINEKDSLTLQVSDTNSQLIILDTKNVCISNEKIALNHELNGNSHTNICKDTRSNSKNKENKYENVRMENSMAQQLGNYTVTIPLEKVSEIEINWKNKTYNKKDHNNSSVKMKMENNSKHDNNSESIVADIHTDTTDHISEEKKNNILNIVEKETESEEKPKIIKSSEEEYILDQNLKLESKQNSEQMKEDNNNVFNSISEKSNDTNKVLTQSVASQDNMLEATPTVNEQKEEVIQKNISELLVEISIETKENKSTDIAEVENKNSEEQHEDAQNSQEFIEHEIHESKKQLNTKDNFDKIKSVKLEGEYVSKSENNISDTIAQADADTKRKRKNSTFEENICSEKKSKLSEINIDVSPFSEIQDANNKSPKLLSPLSTNRKKDKKTIECIISQLKEEKVNSMEASVELSKSQLTSSPITVDVSTLRKKLLQKIKGHSLLKNCQSAGEGANIVSTDDKSSQLEILPLNSEIAQTNTIQVKIPSRSETTKLNDEDIIKKKLLTDVYSPIITPPETASEMECNIIEEEISSEEIFQKKSDIGEVDSVHNCENPQNLKEAESMLAQNVATYTYDDFIDSSDKNITNNIETPVLKLKEEEITEGYANSESLSAADNILENMEKENNNSSKNSSHNVESSMSKSEEEEITDGHGNSESLSATDKILENVEKENNNSKDITNNLESSMSKLKEEEITEDGNHGNSESLSAADKILENMEKGNNSSKNITNNVKDSMSKLEEEEITEDHGNSESLPAANKIVENMEKKNNNGSNNLSITDIELEKTAVFLCETSITTEVSDNSSNKNESTFDIESATDEIRCGIKENPETIILSPVIECETISPTPEIISESILLPDAKVQKLDENAIMVPISNDAAALSTPLVGDSSENAEEETDDSFSQSKESFSDTCLENSSKKTMTESANPCEFDTANVETNLLNLCDLMLHVDTVGNVTRNMEESVSSETVCILSDIISTPISSTDSKLSCVSSTGAIKLFTFPVTSQTEIKEQFIPMNEVNTNKSIFDESPTAAEKLPSNKNRDCLFSLNEQIDNSANPQTLTFPSISLNLQDVHFTKIPIDSTQMFDLISPIQTSTTSNFMNEIPVDNEINDMSEARGSNVIDHNYTLEPLGKCTENMIHSEIK